MHQEAIAIDGSSAALADLAPGVELEALAHQVPRWRQWLGPILSLAIVGAVLARVGGIDARAVAAMLPSSGLFWLLFAACYLAQPATEWVIFRRLWRLPAGGILPLLRKQVGNEVLLGYVGEVYFYGWARRHAEIVAAPFGAIKDVTILSAMTGNLVTLAAMAAGWPLLAHLPPRLHPHALVGSVAVVIATSLGVTLLRHRLFSLPRPALAFVAATHLVRILGSTLLSAAMWHLLLPAVPLSAWLVLAMLRLLVSRLPLVSNKELLFAGLAFVLVGRGAAVGDAVALIATLMLAAHVTIGLLLGAAELVPMLRGRAAA